MTSPEQIFIELIQVSLGIRKMLSRTPSDEEWKDIFDIAQKQAVAGVTFDALDGLSQKGQKLPTGLLFEWIGLSEQIKQQNLVANKRCKEITEMFAEAGFATCILKGQGNAMMYPNPLARTSGDIDIWVDTSKEKIVDFVKVRCPQTKANELHVDFPIFNDVDVEVHFKPAVPVSVFSDYRFNTYFEKYRNKQFRNEVELPDGIGKVCVPTIEFNLVYQMAHMMKHFFSEGLGIRHLMDYYYVLMSDEMQTGKDYTSVFYELGMLKFTKAVMWVLGNVFLLDGKRMVCEPDERRGKLLLQEIMAGGNFGHSDERFAKRLMTKSTTFSILIKNAKLLWLFPEEAIMAPVSNVIRRLKNI